MNGIKTILRTAKSNLWPYPKTIGVLKEAGVLAFATFLHDSGFNSVYQDNNSIWQEWAAFKTSIKIATKFEAEGIRAALNKHANNKTNYLQFLTEIAANGVACYIVNILDGTIIFLSQDPSFGYKTTVPFNYHNYHELSSVH